MTDAMPAQTEAREEAFAVGETVQISRGALAGLRGTVSGFTADERCILTIDGVAPGVRVVISKEALQHEYCADEAKPARR